MENQRVAVGATASARTKRGWVAVAACLLVALSLLAVPPAPAGASTPTVVAVLSDGVPDHPDFAGLDIRAGYDAVDRVPLTVPGARATEVTGAMVDQIETELGSVPADIAILPVGVLDDTGYGFAWHYTAGVDWAVANGADLVVMHGTTRGFSSSLRGAIISAVEAGVTIVCNAGNDGQEVLRHPAISSPCLSVGAVDADDNRAPFSNTGVQLEMVALGVDVETTTVGGGYTTVSDTSMAVAKVAGAAAVLHHQGVPGDTSIESGFESGVFQAPIPTPGTIPAALFDTAVDLGDPGHDPVFGWGRLGDLAPPTPEEQLEELVAAVEALGIGGGLENSLVGKLGAALESLGRGNIEAATGQLQAFINHVTAQAGKKLPADAAADLAAAAERLQADINNLPPIAEPPPALAVAYTNVDGTPGFDAAGGDVLIARLVDTNEDGVPSIGDTVETNQYPTDFTGTTFGTFGVTSHVVDLVVGADAQNVDVWSGPSKFVWSDIPDTEVYAEFERDDAINTFAELTDALTTTSPFGESISVLTTSPSAPDTEVRTFRPLQATDDAFLEIDITP